MSKTYQRVFTRVSFIPPHGHCEAMKQRNTTSLKVADREIKKIIKGVEK